MRHWDWNIFARYLCPNSWPRGAPRNVVKKELAKNLYAPRNGQTSPSTAHSHSNKPMHLAFGQIWRHITNTMGPLLRCAFQNWTSYFLNVLSRRLLQHFIFYYYWFIHGMLVWTEAALLFERVSLLPPKNLRSEILGFKKLENSCSLDYDPYVIFVIKEWVIYCTIQHMISRRVWEQSHLSSLCLRCEAVALDPS